MISATDTYARLKALNLDPMHTLTAQLTLSLWMMDKKRIERGEPPIHTLSEDEVIRLVTANS